VLHPPQLQGQGAQGQRPRHRGDGQAAGPSRPQPQDALYAALHGGGVHPDLRRGFGEHGRGRAAPGRGRGRRAERLLPRGPDRLDGHKGAARGRDPPRDHRRGGAASEGSPRMGKIAFVFSGQGAQYAGMGRELYEQNEAARGVFDRLEKLRPGTLAQCFEGPAEVLTRTVNT